MNHKKVTTMPIWSPDLQELEQRPTPSISLLPMTPKRRYRPIWPSTYKFPRCHRWQLSFPQQEAHVVFQNSWWSFHFHLRLEDRSPFSWFCPCYQNIHRASLSPGCRLFWTEMWKRLPRLWSRYWNFWRDITDKDLTRRRSSEEALVLSRNCTCCLKNWKKGGISYPYRPIHQFQRHFEGTCWFS